MIEKAYLDNINEWSQIHKDQKVETELLFEDEYNTKSFITGVYNKELNYIKIRILRMFTSKAVIETKDDLMVSCDLDIDYRLRCNPLSSNSVIKTEIKELMNIIQKTYVIGARVGLEGV